MRGRAWTASEDEALLAGLAAGHSHARIAAATRRPVNSIRSRIDTLSRNDPELITRATAGPLALPPKKPRTALPNMSGTRKPRRCLGCGREFDSAHAGNRICTACKGRADRAHSPYAP